MLRRKLKSISSTVGPKAKYSAELAPAVRVPMRDGVRLSTDIYFPTGYREKLPVILLRTPYGKNDWREDSVLAPRVRMFVGQGFICAVQDTRGRYESEGEYRFARDDAQDGYDAIEWLAGQSWCNGRIGTFGCSYMGEVQIYTARLMPPSLKAMIPCAAGGATGTLGARYTRFAARLGGVFCLSTMVGWMYTMGSKIFARLPAEISDLQFQRLSGKFESAAEVPDIDYDSVLNHLPIATIMEDLSDLPTDYMDVLSHDYHSDFWAEFDYLDETDVSDVPTLHIDSWFDTSVAETFERCEYFSKSAHSQTSRENQYAIVAPAVHCKSEYGERQFTLGDLDLGDTTFPFWQTYVDWFDYWLRDAEDKIPNAPKIRYFMMGRNKWCQSDTWPPPKVHQRHLYFCSNGQANGIFGDGRLSFEAPIDDQERDHFKYDPMIPVPTCGGSVCPVPGTKTGPSLQIVQSGPFDQRAVEMRSDVLVYTSSLLKSDLNIAGYLRVHLFLSSSVPDTDITAKLVDVFPDGKAINIQDGILRARYRDGLLNPTLMSPGTIYGLTIDLQATAYSFKTGHALRIEISSSNFPRYERNLNTGGRNFDETESVIAENWIHHSAEHQSYVDLPVLDEGDLELLEL